MDTKKTWDPSDVSKSKDDDRAKADEAKKAEDAKATKAEDAKAKDDDKPQQLDKSAEQGRATHVAGEEGGQQAQVDTETGRVVEPDPVTGGVKPEDQPVPTRPTATYPMNDPRHEANQPKAGMPGYVDRDAERLEELQKAAKSSKK